MCIRDRYYTDATLAENIKYLVDRGYQKQITLALDAGRILYQRHYGLEKHKQTFGFAYLFERFIPLLKQVGVSKEAIEDILINNPVSYTHLTLPTTGNTCRSRWSPYH